MNEILGLFLFCFVYALGITGAYFLVRDITRKFLCFVGFHDYEIILSGDGKKVEIPYAPYTYVFFPVETIRTTKCRCCGKIKNVEKSIIW